MFGHRRETQVFLIMESEKNKHEIKIFFRGIPNLYLLRFYSQSLSSKLVERIALTSLLCGCMNIAKSLLCFSTKWDVILPYLN